MYASHTLSFNFFVDVSVMCATVHDATHYNNFEYCQLFCRPMEKEIIRLLSK